MKIEIYQVGKVPPLTVVECDSWTACYDNGTPRLKLMKDKSIVAMFFLNNIAGFKEVDVAKTATTTDESGDES